MSSRPTGRNAFDNLRPSIVREPSRKTIPPDAEARVLDLPIDDSHNVAVEPTTIAHAVEAPPVSTPAPAPLVSAIAPTAPATPPPTLVVPAATAPPAIAARDTFSSTHLLTKKKREVLVPVTFRMNQSLKELLEKVAKEREINQTDLINEGIELNLKRYL